MADDAFVAGAFVVDAAGAGVVCPLNEASPASEKQAMTSERRRVNFNMVVIKRRASVL
jgi:hypothetical protein